VTLKAAWNKGYDKIGEKDSLIQVSGELFGCTELYDWKGRGAGG